MTEPAQLDLFEDDTALRVRAERDRLREAIENILTADEMGWDMDGSLDAAKTVYNETGKI